MTESPGATEKAIHRRAVLAETEIQSLQKQLAETSKPDWVGGQALMKELEEERARRFAAEQRAAARLPTPSPGMEVEVEASRTVLAELQAVRKELEEERARRFAAEQRVFRPPPSTSKYRDGV